MKQKIILLIVATILASSAFVSVTSAQFNDRPDLENCLPRSGIGCNSIDGPYSTANVNLIATVIRDYLEVPLPPFFNPTGAASIIYIFDNGSIYAGILEFPSASDASQFLVYMENYYASMDYFNVSWTTISGFDNAFEGEGYLSAALYHGYFFGMAGRKGRYLSFSATDENIYKSEAQSVFTKIKPEPQVQTPSGGPSKDSSFSILIIVGVVIVALILVAIFIIRDRLRRKR
jgi:hypothetical protein